MKLNVTCPVNSLGYGVVSTNLLLALDQLGCQVSWFPIGSTEANLAYHNTLRKLINNAIFFPPDAPSLRVYHQFDLAQHVGRGKRVGFPIFELTRFKPVELHHLKSQDMLIVPSEWAKEVCIQNGIEVPIFVAPFGVDHSVFRTNSNNKLEPEPRDTIFLNVGKWEYRKGHDIIVQAFNKAFNQNDNVKLFMNCYNPCIADPDACKAYNNDWVRTYKESRLGSKIEIFPERLPTQRNVAKVMDYADCGIFPARAEGWNLDLAEMLAMGKHVIATNYSAHTEFVTPETTMLIEVDELEDAHDGVWFNANDPAWNGNPGKWASLGENEIDRIVHYMRVIHQLKQSGTLEPNKAGADRMKEFTWTRTAEAVIEALNN